MIFGSTVVYRENSANTHDPDDNFRPPLPHPPIFLEKIKARLLAG